MKSRRICVYGAGAIGGHLAVRLGEVPGVELSVIARGAHLAAIRKSGLVLETRGERLHVMPAWATDDPSTLARQDQVFVTLKSASQSAIAEPLARLVAADGHAVFVCNGIPWWWNYGRSPLGPLPLVDSAGALWHRFGAGRALGCVVYSGNEVVESGCIRHVGNDVWKVGEPELPSSARVDATVSLMQAGGLGAEASPDLRADVLRKLMKNAAYNAVCALTRLPLEWLADDERLCELVHAIVDEVHAIATAMGFDTESARQAALRLPERADDLAWARGQRPSMLQDVLAGRPTEADALLGQLVRFAEEVSVPCPSIRCAWALVSGLERQSRLRSSARDALASASRLL